MPYPFVKPSGSCHWRFRLSHRPCSRQRQSLDTGQTPCQRGIPEPKGGMLHVNDLTYRIGDRLILDHASFNLPDGAKVGLVGRNGAGKTTLFKIIQGDLAIESGTVTLPRGMKIGAVS